MSEGMSRSSTRSDGPAQSYTDDVVDTTVEYDTTMETLDQGDSPQPRPSDIDSRLAVKPKPSMTLRHKVTEEADKMKEVDEEESEDEEEPPSLKYTRLTALPARFFNRDPVSACFFAPNVFIFATHSGLIHLCKTDFTHIRTFKAHMTSVLSLHSDGEYFASGSMDGTVVIGSIENESDITKYDFKRPIYAVALDRQYKTTKSFFSGGTSGKLTYSMRGWLGQRQDTDLDIGEGSITLIKTIGDLVFWTNDSGINVMQVTTKTKLLHVPLPKNFPPPEMYWPRLHFIDEDTVLLAWVNHLWTFRIKVSKRSSTPTSGILSSATSSFMSNLEGKEIEIERHDVLEHTLIAGISNLNADLLILDYIAPKETLNGKTGRKTMLGQPPELDILEGMTLEETSVDEVALNNYQTLGFNDYHLEQAMVGEDTKWFLVAANDAVIVEEFNLQDRLTWYTAKGRYLEAWKMSGTWMDQNGRLEIGLQQIDTYIGADDWSSAGKFMGKVLATDPENDTAEYTKKVCSEWNSYLAKFYDAHIDEICDELPTHVFTVPDCVIDPKYYDDALKHYISEKNYDKVVKLIDVWDYRLFDLEATSDLVAGRLRDYDSAHEFDPEKTQDDPLTDLRVAYVDISLEMDEPSSCVNQLIRLRDKDLLQFLDEHHLIETNLDKLPIMFKIAAGTDTGIDKLGKDLDVNITVLCENSHEILPTRFISVFNAAGMQYVNYLYLNKLSTEDEALMSGLEDEMVKLMATYNQDGLLSYLSKQKNYSIANAITVCEDKHCTKELVYLLHKVGENKKALKLIITDEKDPQMAIQFAESVNDKELWDYLLDDSMDRPNFVRALLEAAVGSIDPIPVVTRIPEGMEIEGLKDALVDITRNMSLDDGIYRQILQIISKDTVGYEDIFYGLRLKGYAFDELNSSIRSTMQTLIQMPAKSGIRGLVPEEEVLGKDYVWKGEATDPEGKVKHMSYIKGRMMLMEMQGK